jgi:hypothetical protein
MGPNLLLEATDKTLSKESISHALCSRKGSGQGQKFLQKNDMDEYDKGEEMNLME